MWKPWASIRRAPSGSQLGQIVLSPAVTRQLDDRLDTLLEEYGAVPPGVNSPALDFYQVQVMHEFLSNKVKNPDGTLEPLPPQQPTEVDFHKAVASLGQYPSLMRAMGIAIDLEVPLDGVAPAGNVRVTPSLEGAPPMTPGPRISSGSPVACSCPPHRAPRMSRTVCCC
jgi:hypothetical protein